MMRMPMDGVSRQILKNGNKNSSYTRDQDETAEIRWTHNEEGRVGKK